MKAQKRNIVLILAVMMGLLMAMSAEAFADDEMPADAVGSGILATNANDDGAQAVRFGGNDTEKEWVVIGYDKGKSKMSLLYNGKLDGNDDVTIDSRIKYSRVGATENLNHYAESNLRDSLEGMWLSEFSDQEKTVLLKRTLSGGSANYGEEGYKSNSSAGNDVEDAVIWPLSAEEASEVDLSILERNLRWWLRTPGWCSDYVAYVNGGGNVVSKGVAANIENSGNGLFERPAIDIQTDKIVMTSAVSSGKQSDSVGGNALQAVGTKGDGEAWKLTIQDDAFDEFEASAADGQELLIPLGYDSYSIPITFSGAVVSENTFVSALLCDKDGNSLFYGHISNGEAADTQNVNIPAGLAAGKYTLYVFNEQTNGDGRTDYSSKAWDFSFQVMAGEKWESNDSLPTTSGVYYLTTSVTISPDGYDVSEGVDITIDLNGREIVWNGDDSYDYPIMVSGKLTITDSKGGGGIKAYRCWATILVSDYGEFNLLGGQIYSQEDKVAVEAFGGTVNISGGEIVSSTRSIEADGATVVISGGKICKEVFLNSKSKFTVTGGSFDGYITDADLEASFSLKGGRYACFWYSLDWIADGFTAVNDPSGVYDVEIMKIASAVALDQNELKLTAGTRKKLKGSAQPDDACDIFDWWSSDENVATVSQKGVVYGKSPGTATIKMVGAGIPESEAATCKVTVFPDIWWKKDDNKLYLRAGEEEGYTGYVGNQPWGHDGYTEVIVENAIRPNEMAGWFNGAEDLVRIVNPENIDTSSVTDMSGLFSNCDALTELDLTSFNVSSVQKMSEMFKDSAALETIYVSDGADWKTQAPLTDQGTDMFIGCSQLKGQRGTSYDASKTTADYARPDDGEDAPGYFTEVYKVTFQDGMGEEIKTEYLKFGENATAPPDPTRKGYVFAGWDQDYSRITSELTVTAKWKLIIDNAKIVLSAESLTYNGKVRRPVIKTIKGLSLKENSDYTAKWSNASSKNAGTYTVTVTGKGDYTGTSTAKYTIAKAANTLKIKAKTATVKGSTKGKKGKLKKTKTLGVTKVIKFTSKGQGAKTYAKVSGNKKISIAKKTGKVTVKKGLKKGTYKVKVKVKAAGNANYKASAWKGVTFTVTVR